MFKDREFCADFIDMFFFKKIICHFFVVIKILDATKTSLTQLENQKI
jgi:hypothetical protein